MMPMTSFAFLASAALIFFRYILEKLDQAENIQHLLVPYTNRMDKIKT
jgi:hypothetical protein